MSWSSLWFNKLSPVQREIIINSYELTSTTYHQLIELKTSLQKPDAYLSQEIARLLDETKFNLALIRTTLIAFQTLKPFHTDPFMIYWLKGIETASQLLPAIKLVLVNSQTS